MIQKVIERLAQQAGQMKRLAMITCVAAIGAIKVSPISGMGLSAVFLIVVYWCLESKYLQQERWFRDLFDDVRSKPKSQATDFDMRPSFKIRSNSPFASSLISWSTAGLYVPLIIVLLWTSGGK